MTTTPKLGLTLMATNTAQKEALFNEGLISIEAIVACVAISRGLNTPPVSPVDGDTYIAGTAATGAWASWSNKIVFYYAGWRKLDVPTGMRVFVVAENIEYRWSGATWAPTARTVSTKTVDYTLALVDNGSVVQFDKVTAINCTVPLNATVAFAVGSMIDIGQINVGQLTVVATGGVTINAPNGVLTFDTRYQFGRLLKTATDTWSLVIFGKVTQIEIPHYVAGTPTVSVSCFQRVTSRPFSLPVALAGAAAYAATAPSGGAVNFDVQKNGVSIGTISFADTSNTATFTFATLTSFANGDRLDFVAPANLFGMVGVSFNLLGNAL